MYRYRSVQFIYKQVQKLFKPLRQHLINLQPRFLNAKKSFNQLASHTFRLTAFLSRNYPSYLLHNINKIEELINYGRLKEANVLAEILLDIAEKIEDLTTQALVLRFLCQQAHIQKSHAEVLRYSNRITEVLECESKAHQIYLYLRKNFNISIKDDSVLKSLDIHFAYFASFHDAECHKIRILSKFSSLYLLYYYRPTDSPRDSSIYRCCAVFYAVSWPTICLGI